MSNIRVGEIYYESKVPVGTKIKFKGEKQRYTVQASNHFFSVLNKPFNARKTFIYTIIDWHEQVRGTENLVFGAGAETRKDCEEMLERLTQGETEISSRNRGWLSEDAPLWDRRRFSHTPIESVEDPNFLKIKKRDFVSKMKVQVYVKKSVSISSL